MHKKYEKKYQNFENRWHFGASMAIFLGDISCSLANRIICQTNLDEKLKVNLIHNLSKTLNEVCHGEILDIISNYRELDEKEILKIHELKTASYTIEGPLMMGATIADAEESDIKKLKQYAMLVGKAFQLQDDILGIYGNEEELGKNIGSDLREGKITLLIKKTLQKADKKQEKYIRNLLKNKKISKAEIEKIKKIIEGSGALRETKELSRKMVSEAKKIIEKTHFNKEAKEFLTKLADYVIEREK